MKAKRHAEEMNDILMIGTSFVVTDIETTALSPEKGGMIIEIGAVKIENGEIVDRFQQLIHPERKVYQKTTQLTGITNEMLEGQPTYPSVLRDFYEFLGDSVFVAHNVGFDWDRFLCHFFKTIGLFPNNQVIDTLALSRLYLPHRENHRLDEVCASLDISIENYHRASDDAEATAKMLLIFKERFAKTMYNTHYQLDAKQVDLFDLLLDEVDVKEEKKETGLKVKRVQYWEKTINTSRTLKRLYVELNKGTVYYDVNRHTWFNKDSDDTLDFREVQEAVRGYLHCDIEEYLAKQVVS